MNGVIWAKDLNAGLRRCLQSDPRVYVWGEDVLDPYGGAFKITAGLSTEFPQRVITTPISEAAIVGMAVGAAMRGLLPVVEVMFGDFLLLAADQLVNHAAKFAGMYNGAITVPLVVRTPMGGGRGYGPTHSQTLEKHFLGTPGLRVVAPSHFLSPGEILETAVLRDPMPVLFVENKLLYPQPVQTESSPDLHVERLGGAEVMYPCICVRNYLATTASADVTVVTYGGMSRPLQAALQQLLAEEIRVEAFLPVELKAGIQSEIVQSYRQTRRLVLIEESSPSFGWTAELARSMVDALAGAIPFHLRTLGAADSVIPSARTLEDEMLPTVDKITATILTSLSE